MSRPLLNTLTSWALFLALPFGVFFWLLPFVGERTFGADYQAFPIDEQLALQLSLANGTFPLYVHEFAGGMTASALTMGQLYHPISHLAARIPGYWHGNALEIYTTLCLLSLGIAHGAVFAVLRRFGLDRILASVLSFAVVYNLRMLDLFRYGSSLQNYVGYLLLCVATARLLLVPKGYSSFFFVVLATYLLVCGGHPQMAYLGGLGAALFAGIVPFFLPAIGAVERQRASELARFYRRAFGGMAIGVLASAAYLLPFYFEFLSSNVGRVGKPFEWVYKPYRTNSLTSLLHSVFKPFAGGMEGSFGGSSLLALPLLAPLLALVTPLPRIVLLTWCLVVTILLLALAEAVPLYYLFWRFVPLASTFRVPGRVTLMLPGLLLLLLAWIATRGDVEVSLRGRSRRVAQAALLGLAAAVAYGIYDAISWQHFEAKEHTAPMNIVSIPEGVVRWAYVLGVANLLLFASYVALRRRADARARLAALLLVACVVVQVALVMRWGNLTAPKRVIPTGEEIAAAQVQRLGYRGAQSAGFMTADVAEFRRHRKATDRPLAKLFFSAVWVGSREEAFRLLDESKPSTRAVVEGTPAADLSDVRTKRWGWVTLLHATYNRLELAVGSTGPAALVTRIPFTEHWRVRVNGEPAPTFRANGLFLSIVLPRGRSQVEMLYESRAAFWGVAISLLTAVGIVIPWLLRIPSLRLRIVAVVAAVVLALAAHLAWQHSVRSGASLGSKFTWDSERDLFWRRGESPRAERPRGPPSSALENRRAPAAPSGVR